MTSLEYSVKRLQAVDAQIARLQNLDFPYPHSKEALGSIERTFKSHLHSLESTSADSDPQAVEALCASALTGLFHYLPLLGFILRSTNVRNAFEVYGPLLRLARELLGPRTKLLLSSEWDYPPFTYFGISSLRDFVFVGFPAPESSNPLLLPLSGHELGHSMWSASALAPAFSNSIEKVILKEIQGKWDEYERVFPGIDQSDLTGLFGRRTWEPACSWATIQSEESFCDFVGIRIFGVGFMHALAYLLSPTYEGQRPVFYPDIRRRVSNLVMASDAYRVTVPDGYEDLFGDIVQASTNQPQVQFLLALADSALERMVPDLIDKANALVTSANIVDASEDETLRIYKRFKYHIVPPCGSRALADIINAAWIAYRDGDLWAQHPEIESKDETLKELVLKSIEVLEIEHLLGGQ